MSHCSTTGCPSFCHYRAASFLLYGLLAGVLWFAALLPVGAIGSIGYDLSRYGFAAAAVAALVGLYWRPWREHGLGLFLLGQMAGIAVCVVLVPISGGGQLAFSLALYGFPLGLVVLPGWGCFIACWWARRRSLALPEIARTVGVPRQFSLGAVMFIVLVISSFFAASQRLGIPVGVPVCLGGFLSVVAGSQMLINSVPRAISMGTGALLLPLGSAVTWIAAGLNAGPVLTASVSTVADAVFLCAHLVVLGAVWGYIGGVLVAGLFLVTGRRRGGQTTAHPGGPGLPDAGLK